MVFLRVFTIIIVSISISRIIISTSRTDGNEKSSTDVYVLAWGYLDCKVWTGNDVLIDLIMDGTSIGAFNGNCTNNFYYNTTTNNKYPKFSANFAYFDGKETIWKNKTEPECTKYPLTKYDFDFWNCRFGVVVLKKSKKRANHKRRNRKRIF